MPGEALDALLLSRLKSRGIQELLVGSLESGAETDALFLEEDDRAAKPPSVLETQAAEEALQAEIPNIESNLVKGTPSVAENETVVSGGSTESDEEQHISNSSLQKTEEQRFSAQQPVGEIEQRIQSSQTNANEEEASFASALPSLLQDAVRMSGSVSTSAMVETTVKGDEVLRNAIQKFESAEESESAAKIQPSKERYVGEIDPQSINRLEHVNDNDEFRLSGYDTNLGTANAPELSDSQRDEALIFSNEPSNFSNLQNTKARAAAFRDLPSMAGRLATYLAHSLGYVSPAFLYDLAVGVILYFNKVDGKLVVTDDLPKLIQAILSKQHSEFDTAVEDSLEIVSLLETYFQNPECDRTQRDFSQRIFKETLNELRNKPVKLNAWNEERWLQFIVTGPSLTAHSLCSKVSARAIKYSRDQDI